MTHKDIYTKFMIEYDKANVTSSYPSLTEYEIATVLDKAYNALIAQKFTGNNFRRTGFENDVKVMEDLAPLVTRKDITLTKDSSVAENVYRGELEDDHLYYIDGYLTSVLNSESEDKWSTIVALTESTMTYNDSTFEAIIDKDTVFGTDGLEVDLWINGEKVTDGDATVSFVKLITGSESVKLCGVGIFFKDLSKQASQWFDSAYKSWVNDEDYDSIGIAVSYDSITENDNVILLIKTNTVSYGEDIPMDNNAVRNVPLQLVTHRIAKKFFTTTYNLPWIKNPVCYIESDNGINADNTDKSKDMLYVVVDPIDTPQMRKVNVVYLKKPNPFVKDLDALKTKYGQYGTFFDPGITPFPNEWIFELNDTVAEELVSLAIAFALENVESPRLNTKLNMRGLEA